MYRSIFHLFITLFICLVYSSAGATEARSMEGYTLESGHPSLNIWTLPEPRHPPSNKPTEDRIALGRALFFDARLSGDGKTSCASCHNPAFGWADGLDTAEGVNGKKLKRATPSIINSAYNILQMWDGRYESLEVQVEGPLTNKEEMGTSFDRIFIFLQNNGYYSDAFERAYPGEGITIESVGKAIASFERTLISADSRFDRWARGDRSAMTEEQVLGFKVFLDPNKGNCVVCHSPPNFSDDGYHNIGVVEDTEALDLGRFELVPLCMLKGAFKTPTLRDIRSTAPYFHNGSAETLEDVLEHYMSVNNSENDLSPSLGHTRLTELERRHLLDFLDALTDVGDQKNDSAIHGKSTVTITPAQNQNIFEE